MIEIKSQSSHEFSRLATQPRYTYLFLYYHKTRLFKQYRVGPYSCVSNTVETYARNQKQSKSCRQRLRLNQLSFKLIQSTVFVLFYFQSPAPGSKRFKIRKPIFIQYYIIIKIFSHAKIYSPTKQLLLLNNTVLSLVSNKLRVVLSCQVISTRGVAESLSHHPAVLFVFSFYALLNLNFL